MRCDINNPDQYKGSTEGHELLDILLLDLLEFVLPSSRSTSMAT
jgi:hypothetical protein